MCRTEPLPGVYFLLGTVLLTCLAHDLEKVHFSAPCSKLSADLLPRCLLPRWVKDPCKALGPLPLVPLAARRTTFWPSNEVIASCMARKVQWCRLACLVCALYLPPHCHCRLVPTRGSSCGKVCYITTQVNALCARFTDAALVHSIFHSGALLKLHLHIEALTGGRQEINNHKSL